MNRIYSVYIHKSPSNKYYIGITSLNVNDRWKKGNGYKKQPYFYRAIQKYGWDNFEHKIIAENLTKDEACQMEKDLIKSYNSSNKNFGYNISLGGESGTILSQETKTKISNSLKGRKLSNETKKKLSEIRKGYKHSDETKEKLSDIKKGRKWSEEERNSLLKHLEELHKITLPIMHEKNKKRVMNIDTNVIYDSLSEAAIANNIKSISCISRCCKGERKTCNGQHWKFID